MFGYKYRDWISIIDRKTGERTSIKRDSPGFSIADEADYSDKNPMYFNAGLGVGEKIWIHNIEGYIPSDMTVRKQGRQLLVSLQADVLSPQVQLLGILGIGPHIYK
ncbi:MAG: hypothetical protein IIV12_01865, partial [Bacteroidales bacterium]|nr:hypothetical protein [Bacteroidales bacterium]